ncbi:MAG: GNAT family N-acetyltransferase, partial [Erysipelotrichaceae bacterium]
MIVLLTGASHTGKTLLAQTLLEQYQMPYLSLDLLKMGLIRSHNTNVSVEDDQKLTGIVWPIVREMIKMAIENQQDLIVEGCYIPIEWKQDFTSFYLAHIRYVCLVMSEDYIKSHFAEIKCYANVVEQRLDDSDCTIERLVEENNWYLQQCLSTDNKILFIDESYDVQMDLDIITESERLYYRKIQENDYAVLCEMLQDPEVMKAWEHAFTDDEVYAWIQKCRESYQKLGYGYFLAIEKETDKVVGQIGLLDEVVNEQHYVGLGYILNKNYWHQGYALEGAKAMMDYAFDDLQLDEVIATIRPENLASIKVAKGLKMTEKERYTKRYQGKEMEHIVYQLRN